MVKNLREKTYEWSPFRWLMTIIATIIAGFILTFTGYVALGISKVASCELDIIENKKSIEKNRDNISDIKEKVARIDQNTQNIIDILKKRNE